MKTRERSILIGVLTLAGLALLVDRVILGSGVTNPSESSAGMLDLSQDPASLLIDKDLTPTKPVIDLNAPSLADRVRDATAPLGEVDEPTRNAFALSPEWRPTHASPVDMPGAQISEEAFTGKYQLEAILVTDNRQCAVINGKLVYHGQSLEGYRLVEVNKRSATFEAGRARVTLVIQTATLPE